MPANNPSLYNAALAGCSGGGQERWITSSETDDYLEFRNACIAFATEVDEAIPTIAGNGPSIADIELLQSICQGVLAGRFPVNGVNYTQVALAIAALFTELRQALDPSGLVPPDITTDDVINVSNINGGKGNTTSALNYLLTRTPLQAPVNEYDLLQPVKGSWGVEPAAPTPNTSDVWSWNGSIWVPRSIGAAAIRPFTADGNTVGLWPLNGSLVNTVDPGNPVIIDGGGSAAEVYAAIVPGQNAFYFNGLTRLKVSAFVPALARTGDITFALIIQLDEDPTSSTIFCGHGASGETQAANILYSMTAPNATPPRALNFLSEHGAGVNDSYTTSAPASIPPIHNIGLIGCSRISGVSQFYFNGKPLGLPSPVLTTPDGGGSGRFYIGASDGTTTCTRLLCWGCMVQNVGWSASDWLNCYNTTLGPAFGTLT